MPDPLTAKRALGRSGISVTAASLGSGGLGNFFRRISNADAQALLAAVWEAGIRYFDTAPFYGRGRSERRLGAFLEQQSRDSYVLSTKVGRILTPARGGAQEDGIFYDPAPFNSSYDYSYDGVMRSYEMSLQRLGSSHADVLLVHDIGVALHGARADSQLELLKKGGLRALEELRSRGDIRAYGLGVTEVEACLDCLDYADPDVFLLAGRFSLLDGRNPWSTLQLRTRIRGGAERGSRDRSRLCEPFHTAQCCCATVSTGQSNSRFCPVGGRYDYEPATLHRFPAHTDSQRLLERAGFRGAARSRVEPQSIPGHVSEELIAWKRKELHVMPNLLPCIRVGVKAAERTVVDGHAPAGPGSFQPGLIVRQ